MGIGAILGVAMVGVATLSGTGSAAAAEPVIVVTGSGSVEMHPDRVTVEFSVISRARTAAEASEETERRTKPILVALHALGVPDTAVTSAGFVVQPPWDSKRGVRKENESVATHRIRVRVSQIRTAGEIVETVLDNGADRIETVSFTVSNTDSARQATLTRAVRQARDDAEIMARAAGGELGPLIEVTTQGTAAPPQAYEVRNSSTGPYSPPSITPGPTVVRVIVLGRWAYVERE